MNIGQIKIASWTTAALLTIGLSYYVWTFVSTLEQKQAMPDGPTVKAVLDGVEAPKQKTDDVLGYEVVKRLFHELNWTGAIKAKPVAAGPSDVNVVPVVVPVKDLVHIMSVIDDLADHKGSNVFLRYKQKAGVATTGTVGGFLLHEGDMLAKPQDSVKIEEITAEGVVFSFADKARAKETIRPEEFDAKAQIVQVGPDGIILPPQQSLIPKIEGQPFRPGHTTLLSRNHYVLGSEDMTFANDHYTDVISQVRTSQHRDLKTGKYDGIEINDVPPGSFAANHGAQDGDIVKSINGHPVNSTQEAINYAKMNSGKYTTWEIVIENQGKTRTVIYESPSN